MRKQVLLSGNVKWAKRFREAVRVTGWDAREDD
jgi:hypothetical protein